MKDGTTDRGAGTPEPKKVLLHEHLLALRMKKGLTQAQLAEASGLTVGIIERFELNQRRPSNLVLEVLARALGVSHEELVEIARNDQPPPMASIPAEEFRTPSNDPRSPGYPHEV